MRRGRRHPFGERGAAAAVAALWLPLALLALGWAADHGRARFWRGQLQHAADAAALAAATRVAVTTVVDGHGNVLRETVETDEPAARGAAAEVLAENLTGGRLASGRVRLLGWTLSAAGGGEVEVRLHGELETVLLRIGGHRRVPLAVRAAARPVLP